MYFLNEEERRYLLRKLLPEARRLEVAEELRGWNWHQPPLSPVYAARLGVYEVANRYCETGRDVYWRRVRGVRALPSAAMVEGVVLHRVVATALREAKRVLLQYGPAAVGVLEGMRLPWARVHPKGEGDLTPEVREKAESLWAFERRRVVARVEEVLARYPDLEGDALLALAVPVSVEQRVDGRFLGLSGRLSVDALQVGEWMVMDLKFGERRDFHPLGLAGYALALESVYEVPVTLGCVVYARYCGEGRWRVEREFHLLGDEVRQWFVEARDERARMVEEGIDPGLATRCPGECPYWRWCHGGGGG